MHANINKLNYVFFGIFFFFFQRKSFAFAEIMRVYSWSLQAQGECYKHDYNVCIALYPEYLDYNFIEDFAYIDVQLANNK